MLQTIARDLLTIERGILTHQCNCMGAMGAGIALAIRKKWPKVYNHYLFRHFEDGWFPGEIQLVEVAPELLVCNMAGQEFMARDIRATDYKAVNTMFEDLAFHNSQRETPLPIYVPYFMGCGLAGGDWTIYSGIIEKYCPDAIVCKLPVTKKRK